MGGVRATQLPISGTNNLTVFTLFQKYREAVGRKRSNTLPSFGQFFFLDLFRPRYQNIPRSLSCSHPLCRPRHFQFWAHMCARDFFGFFSSPVECRTVIFFYPGGPPAMRKFFASFFFLIFFKSRRRARLKKKIVLTLQRFLSMFPIIVWALFTLRALLEWPIVDRHGK